MDNVDLSITTDFFQVLIRYISQSSTDSEKEQVEDWLKENPDHQDFYEFLADRAAVNHFLSNLWQKQLIRVSNRVPSNDLVTFVSKKTGDDVEEFFLG